MKICAYLLIVFMKIEEGIMDFNSNESLILNHTKIKLFDTENTFGQPARIWSMQLSPLTEINPNLLTGYNLGGSVIKTSEETYYYMHGLSRRDSIATSIFVGKLVKNKICMLNETLRSSTVYESSPEVESRRLLIIDEMGLTELKKIKDFICFQSGIYRPITGKYVNCALACEEAINFLGARFSEDTMKKLRKI